jgi:hypothetical protein
MAGRADVRWGDGYHLPIVGVNPIGRRAGMGRNGPLGGAARASAARSAAALPARTA